MAKKTPAQHFRDLFNRFMAGSTEHERKQGERAMDAWLKRHGKTRIDAPKVLTQAEADDKAAAPPPPPSDPRDAGPAQSVDSGYTVLDLIRERVELYLVFSSPHEYVAYTLWAAYTHVYEFYQHAPRLVITSPTSGCGKSPRAQGSRPPGRASEDERQLYDGDALRQCQRSTHVARRRGRHSRL